MNFKPSIAVGWDREGKAHLLYLGPDADRALEAMQNAPADIVHSRAYKRPDFWRRRDHKVSSSVNPTETAGSPQNDMHQEPAVSSSDSAPSRDAATDNQEVGLLPGEVFTPLEPLPVAIEASEESAPRATKRGKK